MKSLASFSRRAGWPQRTFKLAYPATHCGLSGLSTRSPTAITGTLCGVERLGRVDVAGGVLVSIVDHAPENILCAHLPVLRVPRIPALGRFAGKSTDILAARAERDGTWRRSMAAEFSASFAEVQCLGALSFKLGILSAQKTQK